MFLKMRLETIHFFLIQLKHDSEPFCTRTVYSDLSTAGLMKGTISFVGIRAEQQFIMENVPTKTIRELQPKFMKIWPTNVTHNGFTEYDVNFLREYWLSGDFSLCVIAPHWPEWLLTKHWTRVTIKGRISQDKKSIIMTEIFPFTN